MAEEGWIKVFSFFLFLLMGFGFSYLPHLLLRLLMKNQGQADRLLSLGNALAGGIFLGSGFNHMLPEAVAMFDGTGVDWKIPIAPFLSALGFLLVFFLEKVIFLKDVAGHERLVDKEESESESREDKEVGTVVEQDPGQVEEEARHVIPLDDEPVTIEMKDLSNSDGHNHDHAHVDMLMNSKGALPYILLVVLSVHSIIAGLALGIQTTNVWPIFIALAAHKWVEAFAVGVNLMKSKVSKTLFLRSIVFYSSMVPVGIVIGGILSLIVSHTVGLYLEAFVTAFASGTFIYISLVDVLLVEFSIPMDKYRKFAVTLFGFSMITLTVMLFKD